MWRQQQEQQQQDVSNNWVIVTDILVSKLSYKLKKQAIIVQWLLKQSATNEALEILLQ